MTNYGSVVFREADDFEAWVCDKLIVAAIQIETGNRLNPTKSVVETRALDVELLGGDLNFTSTAQ
ncbi:hypothetical protein [Brevibacterium sp. S22]|uniref:hypothetical protein n=1 Tax=Brevibacterium sp. S22 TaxID=2483794 RepID=UPI001F0E0A37|nr:hypothetical protein [Brevibacterium sp. S22]